MMITDVGQFARTHLFLMLAFHLSHQWIQMTSAMEFIPEDVDNTIRFYDPLTSFGPSAPDNFNANYRTRSTYNGFEFLV